jgi:hypothetical protein
MTGKIPKSVGAIIAATAILALTAGTAGAANVYNNIPKPIPGNVSSIGFEATSTSEFGSQVEFAGTLRSNPVVTVLMSSWGCQEGSWTDSSCKTVGGATFPEPITLNIYEVGLENTPGALLGSVTQTFNIPFRPSANKNCTGEDAGKWYKAGTCFNGKATKITFEPVGLKLPAKAIISVAYSTSHYGASPKAPQTCNKFNPQRCPYDGLNVGVGGPPSVGSNPLPEYTYVNSTWAEMYEPEPHGTVGTFGLANGWSGLQPMIKVVASK